MAWEWLTDKTLVINLPENIYRRSHIKSEFSKINNDCPEFFPAIKSVNGADGLKETLKIIFVSAIINDWNKVLIYEDDASFNYPDFMHQLSDLVTSLPINFHILNLGPNLLMPVEQYSEDLFKIRMAYAAHANLYSREAIKFLLPLLDEPLPLDVIIAKHLQPLGKCFCPKKILVTQHPFKSDIAKFEDYVNNHGAQTYLDYENKVILWSKMIKDRFIENTKHLQS